MRNTLNWFELFVTDMPRAQAFYEQVLATAIVHDTEGNAVGLHSARS